MRRATRPIVLIGFYNPDAFILPGTDALQEGLNASLKAATVEASPYTNVHCGEPDAEIQPQSRGPNAGVQRGQNIHRNV